MLKLPQHQTNVSKYFTPGRRRRGSPLPVNFTPRALSDATGSLEGHEMRFFTTLPSFSRAAYWMFDDPPEEFYF
jgi:hypothetical protein